MKNTLSILFIALFGLNSFAQDFPAPSPKAMVSQVVGVTEITVEYSSPGVKGREIFGDLVPYGQLWRTGANKATAITFENDVMLAEENVPAGSYSVFTIPYEDGKLAFILNTETELWGTGDRDNAKDKVTLELQHTKAKESRERLQFTFENTTNNSTDLVFAWGKHRFTVPIKTYTSKVVEENISAKLDEFDQQFRFYASGASYFLEEGQLKKALEMSTKSVELNETFWNTHTHAKIYKELGMNKEAKQWAEKSLDLSQKADYQVYIERNEKLLSEL